MVANNDKIYLSYIGELGEEFQNESQKRINWILSNVGTNQQILDLGCSQGIISILAAQKGNNVLGIDIEEDAIKFANDILQNTYHDVCDKVK